MSVGLSVCMFAYSLITRERLRRYPSNFRVAPGRLRDGFKLEKILGRFEKLLLLHFRTPTGQARAT